MIRHLVVLFSLLLTSCVGVVGAQIADPSQIALEGKVYRVLDGDTVVLKGNETVRYLNIDTPEIGQPFAQEAKAFNLHLVRFKNVRLEVDAKERDSYGRLLAYVYVETDAGWVMVNLELVRAGLAKLLFIPPNGRYRSAFEAARLDAMIHRRGMWGSVQGILTVPELEAKLVECTNEVVTVRFAVASVSADDKGTTRVDAADSRYGFHILFAPDCAVPAMEVSDEWIVTGLLACTLRDGPFLEVTSLDQVAPATDPDDASADSS